MGIQSVKVLNINIEEETRYFCTHVYAIPLGLQV